MTESTLTEDIARARSLLSEFFVSARDEELIAEQVARLDVRVLP